MSLKYTLIFIPYFLFGQIIIKETKKNNYITTKIVNKPFNIFVKSNKNLTGTICSTVVNYNDNNISKWHKVYLNNQNISKITFQVNKASKFSQIKVIFIPHKNINCPSNGIIYYSDNFAIRPYKFIITAFPLKAYAGENFPITFKALDYKNQPCKNYNEIKNTSFKIFTQTDLNCKFGNLTLPIIFHNGIAKTSAIYNNIGLISIKISENSYEFAKIDKKDTPKKDRLIQAKEIFLNIYPYSFKSKTIFSNKNIYFMDINLNKHFASISTKIDAINKNGQIVTNFDKNCFSEEINLKFFTNIHYLKNFIGMYEINNIETNDSNFQRFHSIWKLSKNSFRNGTAFLNIKFNVYKNYKIPIPIVQLNFKNLQINSKNSKIKSKEIFSKELKFYYLRIFTNDIYTDKNLTKTPIYTLVYDKYPYIYKGKEKLINWFIFNEINKSEIKILNISKRYQYKKNITIKNELIEDNKTLFLQIFNKNKKHFVIHLDTPEYLWYSKFSQFNKQPNSYCTSHYCIEYNYKPYKTSKELKEGKKFEGMENNSSTPKQIGIKIYR